MKVTYLVQPDLQLGQTLYNMLACHLPPLKIVFASAFTSLQTIMRIKHQVSRLSAIGTDITFVLGIDLRGTSQEVLQELLNWDVTVKIVKHRISRHTFHSKLYLFEWDHQAAIIIGSNNLTEGGFFTNYEGAVQVTYDLPYDKHHYTSACRDLSRFIDPKGPIVYALTHTFLERLIEKDQIPKEAEARIARVAPTRTKSGAHTEPDNLFGTEEIPSPPPLPAEYLDRLVNEQRLHRRKRRIARVQQDRNRPLDQSNPPDDHPDDALLPAAFYMTLPTLQGPTIPGEARIPIAALDLAKDFWGWPQRYTKAVGPTGTRVYWNWRPLWKISTADHPTDVAVQEVRMYMYENSSDFRFYVRPLVNAGADIGDIVRIKRISEPSGAEYECVLSRKTTPQYEEWIRYCTQPVQNSNRRFGYA